MVSVNYERKYVEDKEAVKAYIAKLKYALSDAYSRIIFQKFRVCDEDRDEKYTNEYTFDSLFPEGNENVVFRKELKKLTLQDYIETVEDRRRKNQDDFRVFSKKYNEEDVYIKIRVNLVQDGGMTFIMSFHFAEKSLKETDFPYK